MDLAEMIIKIILMVLFCGTCLFFRIKRYIHYLECEEYYKGHQTCTGKKARKNKDKNNTWDCYNCGKTNDKEKAFCEECGTERYIK